MRGYSKLIIVLLIGLVALLVSRCNESTRPQESGTFLNINDTVQYVGIATCRQCHNAIYQTFIRTGMGQSYGDADTTKSIAQIDGHSTLYDEYNNMYYHPHWSGDSLYLLEYRLSGDDTIYRREEKMDYVIGSGHHTNSHIFSSNDHYHQAPFTWYAQKGKLDLPPGYENGKNLRFDREIGLECMSCHNASPNDFVIGSENKFSKVPQGIDCERCHGPGELHVSRMMKGEYTDTAFATDYSIVNPKKLPVDLQFELCQRCHLQGNAVLADGKSFLDYRPGMKLSEVMDVYLPKYEGGEDQFIMASHADRFKQSQCFQKSEDFNCISCHNPHISVRETGLASFNSSCAKCHGKGKEVLCSASEAELKIKNFNCVECHMPMSGSADIPHVSIHDHYIRIPGKETKQEELTRFLGLKAINNDKPTASSKARAYLQQYERFDPKPFYLDSALYFLERSEADLDLWTYYYFLKKDYQGIETLVTEKGGAAAVLEGLNTQSYSNAHAWTAYRIGQALKTAKDPSASILFYQRATELAPYVPDFSNKYAIAMLGNNQVKEAEELLLKTIAEAPLFKEAYNNLAYYYMTNGRMDESGELLQKALDLDPDYERAWLNKALFHIRKEQYEKANEAMENVLRINPGNQIARDYLNGLN